MKLTFLIIIITVITSIIAAPQKMSINGLTRAEFFDKFKFNAYMVFHRKEWWRMITSGFLHGSWSHLIFNMLTLYFFGIGVENGLKFFFGNFGPVIYILLYISAVAISSIGDLIKHKNNHYYNAIGASGAVSAILFTSILFNPFNSIYIMFIPIPIPGIVFAPLYLVYCQYMKKRNMDNIGHNAHFWGAIYGLVMPCILDYEILLYFLNIIFNF